MYTFGTELDNFFFFNSLFQHQYIDTLENLNFLPSIEPTKEKEDATPIFT